MSGIAVEALLGLWAAELRGAKERLRALFARPTVAASASAFLDGLLGPERRKTGWMRAEAAGDAGPWRQQAVLGRSQWDADALRDVVRDHAVRALAEPDAVLVAGETGFPRQGNASCGVGRQYTGSAGKVTNCQVRGLLVRRALHDGAMACSTTWCPKGTPLATPALVEGRRWATGDASGTTKTELGPGHNETRSWHGWHRHVTLVMLAFALLAVVRHKADALTPPQKTRSRVRPPSSAGRCRRSVALPAA